MIEVKKDEKSPAVAGGMNAEQFDRLMAAHRAIWQQLKEIGNLLSKLLQIMEDAPPSQRPAADARASALNLRRPLRAYAGFDWSSIGAEVLASDEHGATEVLWQNEVYVRRTKLKFGADIWFSRGDGQEEGKTSYERLITFLAPRPAPEPLPDVIVQALAQQRSNRP